ncbi:hypothetical protein [Duganella sp. BuS-21]|uniref:hypothetical protein n=1 Tax=Duganella sp. BuS-21 TaxID=2943848 RepID=UPI0035A5E170
MAAVGNDGPAAALLYPASYAGVVGLSGVPVNGASNEIGRSVVGAAFRNDPSAFRD